MTEYDNNKIGRLLLSFGYNYAMVERYSQLPHVSYQETQGAISKQVRLMGEFLAAEGLKSFDYSWLKDVVAFVDDYLEKGTLDKTAWEILDQRLDDLGKPYFEILRAFFKAGKVDKENLNGAPLMLLIPGYAKGLVTTCDMVEQVFQGADKKEIITELKLSAQNAKKRPPDFNLS